MTTWQRLANVSGALSLARHIAPAGTLWFATGVAAACTFATQVILARSLAPSQFGAFASALAMAMLVAPIAGFGLPNYWLRIFGEEGIAAKRWIAGSYRVLLNSTLVACLIAVAWATLGLEDRTASRLLLILTTTILSAVIVELIIAKYQLEGDYTKVAVWQVCQPALRLVGVTCLAVIIGGRFFNEFTAAFIFSGIAIFVSAFGLRIVNQIAKPEFLPMGHRTLNKASQNAAYARPPGQRMVMLQSWPFGLAHIFYLIYHSSAIILLQYISGDMAAGIYSAAFTIINALYLLPSAVYQKLLLPRMHRWAFHDTTLLTKTYVYGNIGMSILGICSFALLWLAAPTIIHTIFGAQFVQSIDALRILALGIPFSFLASSAGSVLSTRDGIRVKVKLMGLAASVSLALGLAIIPLYGVAGAAWTSVIAQVVLSGAYARSAAKQMRRVSVSQYPTVSN